MNYKILSQLNQENIDFFFKVLARNADIQNVDFNNIDIDRLRLTMGLSTETSFFLTDDDNKAVGVFMSAVGADTAGILLIYVTPFFRRRGFARGMFRYGLDLLAGHKVKRVTLEVLDNNSGAIRLYMSFGFRKCGDILTVRNETNSFYQRDYHTQCKKVLSLLVMPTIKQFGLEYPWFYKWYYNSSFYSRLIDSGMAEFNAVYYDDRIVGYLIYARKVNSIRIYDYGIVGGRRQLIFNAISNLIHGEKIVTVQILEKHNPDLELFQSSGFYIDFRQNIYYNELSV